MFSNPQKKFSKIYDKYVEKIYRFIFLKVNSQETAQDLCSEVFTRGWKKYKEAQNPTSKIENPQAFLYQIARNLVIDFYRTKGRAKMVSLDCQEMSDPKQDLENSALVRSDMETVKAALRNLKDEYQDVIIWHYLDDLSISEIAKIMERPEGTVRVMLHRGLKELRRSMS